MEKKINKKLKQAREQAKLTQMEVAEKAQISKRHYWRLEAGTSRPIVDVASSIAKALDSTIEDLFFE